jgi:DNA-binding transcriptional ArsR family regulator
MASKRDNRAAELVKALNHPLRRRILWLMRKREGTLLSPTEAADELAHSLSNVSYHFRVLVEAAVIELKSTRQVRGSLQHFYVVAPDVAGLDWVQAILDSTSVPA